MVDLGLLTTPAEFCISSTIAYWIAFSSKCAAVACLYGCPVIACTTWMIWDGYGLVIMFAVSWGW